MLQGRGTELDGLGGGNRGVRGLIPTKSGSEWVSNGRL